MPTQITRHCRIRGDSAELELQALHPETRAEFDLTTADNLIFTAKHSLTDADGDAVFQKELDAGISVLLSVATVEVNYLDTESLEGRATTLFCDLQAQMADGSVYTVWSGTVTFKADVTRGVSPAIPIYTLSPVASATLNRPDLLGLTGGGATNLDGVATKTGALVLVPTGTIFMLSYGRILQMWQLIAGTDAEAPSTGVVRPDDYNASTNARIWVQL